MMDDLATIAARRKANLRELHKQTRAGLSGGAFRENLDKSELVCRVTGITDERFLFTTHIKPWGLSSKQERLDGANGVVLARHACFLFDEGWITFASNGAILRSPHLPDEIWDLLHLDKASEPVEFEADQSVYLTYHHDHIFRK